MAQGSLSDRFHFLFIFSLQSHGLFSSKVKLENIIDSFWVLESVGHLLFWNNFKVDLISPWSPCFFPFWNLDSFFELLSILCTVQGTLMSPFHRGWSLCIAGDLTELSIASNKLKSVFTGNSSLCKSCYLMEKWLLTWDMNSLAYALHTKQILQQI